MLGGVLIGLITISLLVYMFGRISTVVDETSEDTQAKQIADFNSSFDAYNKKLMYGTDVISVLNKAVDNNHDIENDSSSEYYVDIAFRLKREVSETVETYTLNQNTGEYSMETQNTPMTQIFTSDVNYALSTNFEKIKNCILINKKSIVEHKTISWIGDREKKYTLTYKAFDEFKRRAFQCIDIDGDGKNVTYNRIGRVCKLEFEEVRKN